VTQAPVRKLAVLLHADIVGSTSLVQNNETIAHERIQDAFHRLSATISNYGGIAHEIRGDALIAEFARASDAVSASLTFQATNTTFNEQLSDDIRPMLRIGIAMGEVVVADSTVTGEGIVLAQRLEQLAGPGGVVVQGSVSETVPTRMPFEFEYLGEQSLKGFDQPVRAFAVQLKSGEQIPDLESSVVIPEFGTVNAEERPPLELPDKPSVAVLPFTNMSADPEQEYLADGISEDIITELSRLSKLFVVARNSTFTYKGRAVDVKQVGREQGVQYVLEGSVRRSGDRLRITAQLIDASTGNHLWAQRYDRVIHDVFELQDEITREVTSALQVELTEGEQAGLWASGTKNLEAWEIVIQIPELLYSHRRGNVLKARDLAQQALKLDEHYAMAWNMLGQSHWEEAFNAWSEDPETSLKLAADATMRSQSIDDSNPDTFALLTWIHLSLRKYDQAFELGQQAMVLGPNNANAAAVAADVELFCNRPQEMVVLLNKAMRLCPIYPAWYLGDLAWAYLLLDRREDAITTAQISTRIDPDYPFNYMVLAITFAELERELEARTAIESLLRIDPKYSLRGFAESQPFRDSDVLYRHIEGLRMAGLRE
jgi:adenylate cyclase